ncbi:hypothetical protein K438DRAFT_1760878 [Mycena galopus ATCC 62051]|nr:hypothetical protein K438DRAFT_1760878 [Mycena galopus ATCC 62051]
MNYGSVEPEATWPPYVPEPLPKHNSTKLANLRHDINSEDTAVGAKLKFIRSTKDELLSFRNGILTKWANSYLVHLWGVHYARNPAHGEEASAQCRRERGHGAEFLGSPVEFCGPWSFITSKNTSGSNNQIWKIPLLVGETKIRNAGAHLTVHNDVYSNGVNEGPLRADGGISGGESGGQDPESTKQSLACYMFSEAGCYSPRNGHRITRIEHIMGGGDLG